MQIRIAKAAEQDYEDAIAFYSRASSSAVRAFEAEFNVTVDLLRQRPSIGAPHETGTRRKHFPRFPYSLIYRTSEDAIMLLAVMHDRRDPLYWIDRLEAP